MNIYHALSDRYQVESLGAPVTDRQIGFPVWFHRDISSEQPDFLLVESSELPDDIAPESLVVCWGSAPEPVKDPDYTLLYLPSFDKDPELLLAELRTVYDRLLRWFYHSRRIVND